ncbi:hypothetical protein [Ehrlichia muris]|uniref:Uncharacterized protein n=1 Tax=Ehrlichia muris AS145 TaxID=1423892 RepID=V9R8Y1_9RICK|nr:hypothetical protein [Ehrlichia muris]AHC39289.1 hypothetical protein EMUR_02685 [Ehrlichia muris AS145]
MSSFKGLIIRTAGLVMGSLLLIFSLNILMRRCTKKSNYISIAVILLLSIGITAFFKIYGRNENSLTFINIKIYAMLLASALIMFCIANLVLRKESKCHSKFKEQSKKIHSLRVEITNLEIQLNIIKREIEWYFSDLCSDTKICIDIKQEYLLPANKKFYDISFLCKITKFITFGVALLVFLYQSFYSSLNQKFRSVELLMYYTLVSLFLFTFVIDLLTIYYIKENYKSIEEGDNINIFNAELQMKKKLYNTLLKEISKYNRVTVRNWENVNHISALEDHRDKILNILDRI